jgi:hypothetical protein
VEHVAVGFAEVIGPATGAGFEEGGDGAGAGSGFLAGNGAPVVRVGGDQPCAFLDQFVGLGQFFGGGGAFADDDVIRVDAVVGDLAFVERGEQTAFADHEGRAIRVGFVEEIGGVHGRRVKVTGCETLNAEVFEPDGQVLAGGRGIVGEKKETVPKWRAEPRRSRRRRG